MPWPQDNSPVQPQLTPGMALWNYIKNSVPSQLGAAGHLAQSVAQPLTNLFGNGGQEFWNGPQDPQAAHDMSNALLTMYAGSATPGAAEMNPAALNVGIGLRHQVSFNDGGAIYHMLSAETGKPLGHIGVEPRGDALHVTNIEAPNGPNSIGPDGMRDVLQQLKQFYPDAKTIEGQRVSGARFGGEYNSYDLDNSPTVSVKLRSGSDKGPNPVAAAMMAESQPQNALTGIKAFHGSPYDFDRFDASKIGTGEGAQSYGHGLYFAESPGVAKSYRENLTNDADPHYIASDLLERYGGDRGQAAERLRKDVGFLKTKPNLSDGEKGTIGAYDLLRGNDPINPPGKMYEVNINADPASFLDWDKPLREQNEAFRGPLSQRAAADNQEMANAAGLKPRPVNMENILGLPGSAFAPRTRAEVEALKQAGIPGIRYLDQGSRGAGEGSHNYVVFPGNEHLIEIVKKYGIAATAAMMGMKGSDISQMMGLVGPQQAPQR